MIPKVAGSGHSFEGAGQYYLHDKLESQQQLSDADRLGEYTLHDKDGQQTSFRVGFTSLLNMAADTPQQAIAQMTASYERYREREANKRGRKLVKPVYAYSLAWAPDQTPTQDEMMAAVRSSLKALRLDGLQTLIVQHTDEPHPHIHVIVNRIELDGTRARNIPFDHLRFSRWAEQYERDHGGIRCEQRVRNNELRRQGIMVRDTASLSRAEFTARERLKDRRHGQIYQDETFHLLTQGAEVSALLERHRQELARVERSTRERMASDRHALKAEYAPQWRSLYAAQHVLSQAVKAANNGGILERACFIFSNRELLRKGGRLGVLEIAKLALSSNALTLRVDRIQAKERAQIGASQQKRLEEKQQDLWQAHTRALAALSATQQVQKQQLRDHLRQSWALAQQMAQTNMAKPPPQPIPVAAPQLNKGLDLRTEEINEHLRNTRPLLRNTRPLRDAHQKSTSAKIGPATGRDGPTIGGLAARQRKHDRGPRRRR